MKALLLPFSLLLVVSQAQAQLQWRFHVAFEDATGAKDTLWFIYDTTATGGLDAHLGEVRIDIESNMFNVWAWDNLIGPSQGLKVVAEPYSEFPQGAIYAINGVNYTPPLIVRWDTSLFRTPYLPTTDTSYIRYAWLHNYYFPLSGETGGPAGPYSFDMLAADSVVVRADLVDWFFTNCFMMFSYGEPGWGSINEHSLPSLGVFPNPARERVMLTAAEPLAEVRVMDVLGRLVLTQRASGARVELDVGELVPGSYFVHARGRSQVYRGKVVVE